MRKGTFKCPDNRFDGYLSKWVPEPSEPRLSDSLARCGFNDFITQHRHSSLVRHTASPQNWIHDDPLMCLSTGAGNVVTKSIYKQKKKPSTIEVNGTMSKEIFVAFATQKGGTDKSTAMALAASHLHDVKGYNIAVVDYDDPQHSIHRLCEYEMGFIDSNIYLKAFAYDHLRRMKKDAYTIVKGNMMNALGDAKRMIATEGVKPDVVFLDVSGTLRSNGVVKILSQMDYISTPLNTDRFIVENTLKFVTIFHDRPIATGRAKTEGFYLF